MHAMLIPVAKMPSRIPGHTAAAAPMMMMMLRLTNRPKAVTGMRDHRLLLLRVEW